MNEWQTSAPWWCGFAIPWIVGRSKESKIVNGSNIIVPIKTYTSPSLRTNLSSTTQPWITVTSNKDCSHCTPSRITTTTSPSIPVATANQFSSFNDDNKDEACANSGATINIVKNEMELNNEVITPNGPCVLSTTKNIMQAKAQG